MRLGESEVEHGKGPRSRKKLASMPQLRRRTRTGSGTPPPADIKLKKVVPVIPNQDPEKADLMADLTTLGCRGFADKPWSFKELPMVKELKVKVSNEFDNTDRGIPHRWTDDMWRAVYGFRATGSGLAGRKDDFIVGKFRGACHPKDGYAVEDCEDDRQRRLLRFLVPIIHPEKPTKVTITLGNTIFGALEGGRKVDWGRIISDLVGSLVGKVGGSRASPLSPYLFHLYHHMQLLTDTEEKEWRLHETLLRYGESGSDEEMEEESDSEPEGGPEGEPDEEEEDPTPPLVKRQKVTPPNQRGTPPPRNRTGPEGAPAEGKTGSETSAPEDPVEKLTRVLCDIRADWEVKRQVLTEIAILVDGRPDSTLTAKGLPHVTGGRPRSWRWSGRSSRRRTTP